MLEIHHIYNDVSWQQRKVLDHERHSHQKHCTAHCLFLPSLFCAIKQGSLTMIQLSETLSVWLCSRFSGPNSTPRLSLIMFQFFWPNIPSLVSHSVTYHIPVYSGPIFHPFSHSVTDHIPVYSGPIFHPFSHSVADHIPVYSGPIFHPFSHSVTDHIPVFLAQYFIPILSLSNYHHFCLYNKKGEKRTITKRTKTMSTGQQSACAKVLTFTLKHVVCAHTLINKTAVEHWWKSTSVTNCILFHTPELGALAPFVFVVCVAPFISVVCGHGIGLVLAFFRVHEWSSSQFGDTQPRVQKHSKTALKIATHDIRCYLRISLVDGSSRDQRLTWGAETTRMNCRHDVLAYLGRRGLRDQPSLKLLVGSRPTYEEVEKVHTSEKGK